MPSIQEKILQSFPLPQPKPYIPEFRVEREPKGWRIFDRGNAIGFFGNSGWIFFDLWKFSPFELPIFANETPPGKVVDIHTLHNTVMNMPLGQAGDLLHGAGDPMACLQYRWTQERGAELALEFSGTFNHGQRIRYLFRALYDPAWGRYRYFFDSDAWKLSPAGFEPINMMMAGALHSRPEKRRWSHSVWEDSRGNLRRLVHSNALFDATDYADANWRSKNGPEQGGWIAYAAHPTFNPAVLIHKTNVPVRFATCSQLFDEHIIWQQAGLTELEENFFHFHLHTELVNLSAALAADLLERAADAPRPRQWRYHRVALPFAMDRENSFESPVDPWRPEDCPILTVDNQPGKPIRWANDAAHSGKHSLRFEGTQPTGWTVLCPSGAVCNVEPHTRYRFSAWVRTKDVERFARLELHAVEYSYTNIIGAANSPEIRGTTDWTLLSVELDSGEEAYVNPRMALYGTGVAWFDDVKLELMGVKHSPNST